MVGQIGMLIVHQPRLRLRLQRAGGNIDNAAHIGGPAGRPVARVRPRPRQRPDGPRPVADAGRRSGHGGRSAARADRRLRARPAAGGRRPRRRRSASGLAIGGPTPEPDRAAATRSGLVRLRAAAAGCSGRITLSRAPVRGDVLGHRRRRRGPGPAPGRWPGPARCPSRSGSGRPGRTAGRPARRRPGGKPGPVVGHAQGDARPAADPARRTGRAREPDVAARPDGARRALATRLPRIRSTASRSATKVSVAGRAGRSVATSVSSTPAAVAAGANRATVSCERARRRRAARGADRPQPLAQPLERLELADEPLQPGGLLADRLGGRRRVVADGRPVGEGGGEPADDRQRRAQVVAEVGQQPRLARRGSRPARRPSR